MSNYSMSNDVPLPHAGLLAYFHSPTSSPRTSNLEPAPPPYDVCNTPSSAYSPITTLYSADDEESQYGFWGECDSSEVERDGMRLRMVKRDHQGFYSFCCFWCAALVCFIGAVGVIFTTDLALSSLGIGTGLAKWVVDTSANADRESSDMHFCLISANREAPGPQIWRYMNADDIATCRTHLVTLTAGATEHWKLHIDDEIMLGDDVSHTAGFDGGSQFMEVDRKAHIKDMEGDEAIEGGARSWDLY